MVDIFTKLTPSFSLLSFSVLPIEPNANVLVLLLFIFHQGRMHAPCLSSSGETLVCEVEITRMTFAREVRRRRRRAAYDQVLVSVDIEYVTMGDGDDHDGSIKRRSMWCSLFCIFNQDSSQGFEDSRFKTHLFFVAQFRSIRPWAFIYQRIVLWHLLNLCFRHQFF